MMKEESRGSDHHRAGEPCKRSHGVWRLRVPVAPCCISTTRFLLSIKGPFVCRDKEMNNALRCSFSCFVSDTEALSSCDALLFWSRLCY